MYVNPFVAGVLSTILIELATLFVISVISTFGGGE